MPSLAAATACARTTLMVLLAILAAPFIAALILTGHAGRR